MSGSRKSKAKGSTERVYSESELERKEESARNQFRESFLLIRRQRRSKRGYSHVDVGSSLLGNSSSLRSGSDRSSGSVVHHEPAKERRERRVRVSFWDQRKRE